MMCGSSVYLAHGKCIWYSQGIGGPGPVADVQFQSQVGQLHRALYSMRRGDLSRAVS